MDRGGGEIVQHKWNANFFLIGNLPPKKTERKEASVHVNLEGTGRKRWEEMD